MSEHLEALQKAIAELRQENIPTLRRATAAQNADAAITALSADPAPTDQAAPIESLSAPSGGWVLVPRVPTQEMLEAGEKKACVWQDAWECGEVYRDMLAAAPHPPAEAKPVGVETVDAAAWNEALELPEGYRVAEHLPGIWEYQFDIEDESDDDSDRKVSRTPWNHPALAAIAAWGHAYDALAQQRAAVYEASIYWRAMYRLQTAMRYMDNNPKLTPGRAFEMADEDVARLTAALAAQEGGRDDD